LDSRRLIVVSAAGVGGLAWFQMKAACQDWPGNNAGLAYLRLEVKVD